MKPASGSPSRQIARTAFRMLTLIGIPACLVTTAAYFWDGHVLLAQCSPFRLQYAVLLVLHTAFCLIMRHPRVALFFAVFAVLNVFAILRTDAWSTTNKPNTETSPALRIVYANVHTENTDAKPLLALIRTEQPDLVALLEVNQRWTGELVQGLGADYTHRLIQSREDNFGVALFSRRPFVRSQTKLFSSLEVPSLAVSLEHSGHVIRLLLTHPVPPSDQDGVRWRNEHLRSLPGWASSEQTPGVIVGDLNATPWCPPVRRLMAQGRLTDASRRHAWYPATWPVNLPHLRIPIDHVLINNGFVCLGYRIGPDIGSDHYPVIFSLRPTDAPPDAGIAKDASSTPALRHTP